MLLGDSAEASSSTVLLLHEARVEVSFVVAPTDWLQAWGTDPPTPGPLEDSQTSGHGNLQIINVSLNCFFNR